MTNIKYKSDYGYPAGSPLFIVANDEGVGMDKAIFASKDDAEKSAANLAVVFPGKSFHVMASIAVVRTSAEVVGERFDPHRVIYPTVEETAPPLPEPEVLAANEEEPS